MSNKINTGGKLISIITGALALLMLPDVISHDPNPLALMFISLFGGATIALALRSFCIDNKLGWIQGILIWIGGAIVGGQSMNAILQAYLAGMFAVVAISDFRRGVILTILYGLLVGGPLLWLGFRKYDQKRKNTLPAINDDKNVANVPAKRKHYFRCEQCGNEVEQSLFESDIDLCKDCANSNLRKS